MKNYSTETITNENEIGPQVYHLYIIRNDGPASVIEAETNIYWPSHTLSGIFFKIIFGFILQA